MFVCASKILPSGFATGEYQVGWNESGHGLEVAVGATFTLWDQFSSPLIGANAGPCCHMIMDIHLSPCGTSLQTEKRLGAPALQLHFHR